MSQRPGRSALPARSTVSAPAGTLVVFDGPHGGDRVARRRPPSGRASTAPLDVEHARVRQGEARGGRLVREALGDRAVALARRAAAASRRAGRSRSPSPRARGRTRDRRRRTSVPSSSIQTRRRRQVEPGDVRTPSGASSRPPTSTVASPDLLDVRLAVGQERQRAARLEERLREQAEGVRDVGDRHEEGRARAALRPPPPRGSSSGRGRPRSRTPRRPGACIIVVAVRLERRDASRRARGGSSRRRAGRGRSTACRRRR